MKGIVVGTSEYTKDFLKPLLESIKETKYNILIVSNGKYKPDLSYFNRQYELVINSWNGWELAVVQRGKETFSEFVHIMDTTLIKDISMFDKLFEMKGNVVLTKGNFHYMGKFATNQLPNLPIVHDKTLAIYLEVRWLDGFPYTEFKPDLPVHTNVFEEIHGMKRMRLENKYMIKWKGTHWVTQQQRDEIQKELIKEVKVYLKIVIFSLMTKNHNEKECYICQNWDEIHSKHLKKEFMDLIRWNELIAEIIILSITWLSFGWLGFWIVLLFMWLPLQWSHENWGVPTGEPLEYTKEQWEKWNKINNVL